MDMRVYDNEFKWHAAADNIVMNNDRFDANSGLGPVFLPRMTFAEFQLTPEKARLLAEGVRSDAPSNTLGQGQGDRGGLPGGDGHFCAGVAARRDSLDD